MGWGDHLPSHVTHSPLASQLGCRRCLLERRRPSVDGAGVFTSSSPSLLEEKESTESSSSLEELSPLANSVELGDSVELGVMA